MSGAGKQHANAGLAWFAGLACALAMSGMAPAQTISIVASPHDLSASSGGTVHASVEDEICIFCHTPHNASPIGALWNRSLSPKSYQVYTSRALDASPGQPTGSSKLCLSCHDGTIALGLVLSKSTPIQMSGGSNTLTGPANLGTDLRDDHPISFVFDSSLSSRDGHLRAPSGLPAAVKLDTNRELQCTTCHDAHNNAFGNFLVMNNTASELCISCHNVGSTNITGHSTCTSCHQSHTAPSGPYLLKRATASRTCLACHDGSVTNAANIKSDVDRAYSHDNDAPVDPNLQPQNVMVCTSCHDPHTMQRGVGATPPRTTAPRVTAVGRLGQIDGVTATGAVVQAVTQESEACFRCHGNLNPVTPSIPRRTVQTDMAQQFSPSAISMHPVGFVGRSTDVPSLKPGWSEADIIQCSDCHSSSSGTGSGAHGSQNEGLLVARMATIDRTSESAAVYALCYRCHDRQSILGDDSFSLHKKHIVDVRTPCTVCHDSHGIASAGGSATGNAHLINFATDVVLPNSQGQLRYESLGAFQGRCNLRCHNENHVNETYPGN